MDDDYGSEYRFRLPGIPKEAGIARKLRYSGKQISPEKFAAYCQAREQSLAEIEKLFRAAQTQIDVVKRNIERLLDPHTCGSSTGILFGHTMSKIPDVMVKRSLFLGLIKGHELVQERCRGNFWSIASSDKAIEPEDEAVGACAE